MPVDPFTAAALTSIAKAAAEQLNKRATSRCSCGGETCLNCFLAFLRRGTRCPVCTSTSVAKVVVGDGSKVYRWFPGGKIEIV